MLKKYKNIYFINNLDILSDMNFDLIIFRGTFQYIKNIIEIKEFIDKKLKKGGYLVLLSIPNKNSPLAYIQREDWNLYIPLEMFNIFSKNSIINIFDNLEIKKINYPYLETPYASEMSDLLKLKRIMNGEKLKIPFWGSMMEFIFQK